MVSFYNPEKDRSFYIIKNIAITKDTTASDYYEEVKHIIRNYWDIGSFNNKEDYTFIIVKLYPYIKKNSKPVLLNKDKKK